MKKLKNIFTICFLSFFSFINKIIAATPCKTVVGGRITQFIIDLFDTIKWVALALGIALGMLDFFKAITGGKDDALSKAAQRFAKRMIAIVILFILPVLLNWILGISGVDHGGTCLE